MLICLSSMACWYQIPCSRDNMIFRLMEDVSPYYHYNWEPYYSPTNSAEVDRHFRAENIKLWRKQTHTTITDEEIERYVYTYTEKELKAHKASCCKNMGEDAYKFLLFAKKCEATRQEINDPWYYPTKGQPLVKTLQKISEKVVTPRDKYFNRYVLQSLRAMITIRRDYMAVDLWEKAEPSMEHDIIRTMAERVVARAYLKVGNTAKARKIYARVGDIASLYECVDDPMEMWEEVFRENPNSPFFQEVLQSMLTHFDNRYLDKMQDYGYELSELKEDMDQLNTALKYAKLAIHDRRVKNKAMWYYSAAALLASKGDVTEALSYAERGKAYCTSGSFMANSMRVLRIFLEAQTCQYDSAYASRLANDMTWLSSLARRHITSELKEELTPRVVTETWGEATYQYIPDIYFTNKMYWSDAMNRILVDVLAPRLKRQGRAVDALMVANLGEFWLPKNATGSAHSPNTPNPYGFTDHSNAMAHMADTCSATTLMAMYKRLKRPANAMDRLVQKNGLVDKDYWCDVIGTHCIAEHRYKEAVSWLRGSSASYQRGSATWAWFDRDPFCLKIGYSSPRRHHVQKKADYKLAFAKRMNELCRQMTHARTADKRAEAMILYGVGLRNQSDWCWALTRYTDFIYEHDEYLDTTNSQTMIDKGLAAMRDKELKARYLHAFARNKEVMDLCYDTKIAKKLQAHCDVWRDYKKN